MKTTRISELFAEEEMLTVPEFARRLGCSRRRAYQLVEYGHVLALRFGKTRCLRVPASEVERLRREAEEPRVVAAT